MPYQLPQQAEKFKKARHKRHAWGRAVSVLACLVVFCTTYALILPAITLEETAYCGLEEHAHTEACYTDQLICGLEESTLPLHTHTDTCYETQSVLTCGLEESEGHTHSDACYTMTETQTCALEEHTHGEDCYDEAGNLTCTQAEHTHSDACYTQEQVLTCTLEESEGHTHSDACYAQEQVLICQETENTVEPHTHTEECYEQVLSCGLEEHTHTLICYSNPEADVETAAQWEATLPASITGNWAEDLIAVAESQLGYQESTENYILDDSGTGKKGYTRYGAWYGDSYGDWCAMFVSFCLNYADIPTSEFPQDANCADWISQLSAAGRYADGSYTPAAGDLIFFDQDGDGTADHVGILTEVTLDEQGQATGLSTIEGNSADQVRRDSYAPSDSQILGYGILTVAQAEEEQAEEAQTDETTDSAQIVTAALYTDNTYTTLAEDQSAAPTVTGTLPEGAQVRAYPVEATVEGQTVLTAYDITIYLEDGTAYQPETALTVTFPLTVEEGVAYSVYYLPESGDPELMEDAAAGESSVSFTATHFSVYALTTAAEETDTEAGNTITVDGVTYYDLTKVEEAGYYYGPYLTVTVDGSSDSVVEKDYYAENGSVQIALTWALEHQAGTEWFTCFYYQLPDGLSANASGDLLDASGTRRGAYQFVMIGDSCYLLITYDELRIEVGSYVTFSAYWERSGTFTIEDKTITVTNEDWSKTHSRNLTQNADGAYVVDWQIDVGIREELLTYSEITLTDTMSETLTLTSTDDVTIVGVDGSGTAQTLTADSYTIAYDDTTKVMTIVLTRGGDNWEYGAYRITYKTTVAVGTGTVSFSNVASIDALGSVTDSGNVTYGGTTGSDSGLWLYKYDGDTKEPLVGATFTLCYISSSAQSEFLSAINSGQFGTDPTDETTRAAAKAWLDALDESNWTEVTIGITDANGNLLIGDVFGTRTIYRIKETASPVGYSEDEITDYFIISSAYNANSQLIGRYTTDLKGRTGETYDFSFANYQIEASFTIQKVNEKGAALTGATFTLYADDKTTVVETVTMTGNTYTFTGLSANTTYYLAETAAPDGYTAIEGMIQVTVEADGTVTFAAEDGSALDAAIAAASDGTVTVTDQPEEVYVLPETGGTGTYWYTLAGTLLTGGAALLLYKRQRRKGGQC